MPHLKKSATTGHLLKASTGHLVNSCGCTGPHLLCSYCPCDAPLKDSYIVTISGFPAICGVDAFNGAWTVTWQYDCTWYYDIDAWHRVSLYNNAGTWLVQWTVSSPGGAYGWFLGSGDPPCQPDGMTWTHNFCFEPFLCWGLCSGIQATGAVSVG
jgi:hypothetical protein